MNSTSGSVHTNYSSRMRSRSKQPVVYTSDKRQKFTQRESKKWIRFVTVLGYIIFVSLPAVSLSIYYVYIWDPGYIKKFPVEPLVNRTPLHTATRSRNTRDAVEGPLAVDPNAILPESSVVKDNSKTECTCQNEQQKTTQDVHNILFKTPPPDIAPELVKSH